MPLNNQFNNQRNKLLTRCTLLITILLTPTLLQAEAFSANSSEPIRIQSDHAELDEQSGRSTYSGKVVITQGTTILTSNKVIVYTDKSGLIKLEAFGSPAKFSHQQEGETLPTHAYGKEIIYTRSDEKLTLIENAKLEQGKNTFQGSTIEYNTVSGVVTAEGGEKGSQRVEVIVHPEAKKTDDKK